MEGQKVILIGNPSECSALGKSLLRQMLKDELKYMELDTDGPWGGVRYPIVAFDSCPPELWEASSSARSVLRAKVHYCSSRDRKAKRKAQRKARAKNRG